MFHAIAHFSKYIKPGAVRIGCSSFSKDLEVTAAQNTDGTNVLVLLHTGEQRKMVQLRTEGKFTRLLVPGHSISTVILE